MNKLSKKTAFVLVGILALSLVAGNALFAGDQGRTAAGLLSAADATFVSGGFTVNSSSGKNPGLRPSAGIVSAEDLAFLAEPFNGTLAASGPSESEVGLNVVSAADVNFIRNGLTGSDTSNLVCVVDGVRVTGQPCVN